MHPSIISYLCFLCKSSTWKFHIKIYFTSNSGSTISTLMIWLVLKSPSWVLQQTRLVFFFRNCFIYYLVIPLYHITCIINYIYLSQNIFTNQFFGCFCDNNSGIGCFSVYCRHGEKPPQKGSTSNRRFLENIRQKITL